ncbi:efflux RND transporter permease subunit [Serpentinicella alkaliphila]|uniref:HAE1 family hydrophobic/amphiphilic exporter-1 n=1 Tax=Serpentinicella alkaliphila TaxID=1734049 RepID=A0A4R2TDA4_9FIRM|nr:efflux RND transporter permease subunit [Serpentinicella alkaliphila]QUH25059.1 efflux RND transporter permease subunit [Serpentinicella alkaliphila]TCQ00496.1 HAE1 family hydrophobic/amphiphilic exporter-1 [Serpentinicella alkaliphila]
MRLSEISVRRPVTTFMFMLIAILLGVVSITRLPVDLYPEIEVPVAIVSVDYSGAAPEEIESLITIPLEQTLSTVGNLKDIFSYSREGNSLVVVQLEYGTNMDMASLEIREKVDLIKGFLPDGSSSPMVLKIDPNAFPIMQISVSGNMDFAQMQQTVENELSSRLERIDGVASVSSFGGIEQEVKIGLNQSRLKGYGLTLSQVQGLIRGENLNLPGGRVNKGDQELLVRVFGEFRSLEDFKNMPISTPTGEVLRLQDIAEVSLGYKEGKTISRLNGSDNITLSVTKQSVANTVRVAQRVNAEITKLQNEYPDLNIIVALDLAEFINDSIRNVTLNAIMGSLLAILVLFLFLRNLRSTIIVGIAIPVSIIATFALMFFGNITINLISLGGLALGIGMLVDNAIVVLENIYRHREEGKSRIESAILGAKEVSMAVTASTATTIAVFLPIVFVEGFTSIIFKQLAFAVTFSLLASLVMALTVVPMLSSKILRIEKDLNIKKRRGPITRLLDLFTKLIEFLIKGYTNILKKAIKHRAITVIIAIAIFVSSLVLVGMVGGEFFPAMDEGTFRVSIDAPFGTSLAKLDGVVKEIETIISEVPELDRVLTQIGAGEEFSRTNDNRATVTGTLVSQKDRVRSTKEIVEELRDKTVHITGVDISIQETSSMNMSGGGYPIEIEVRGDDIEVLRHISNDFLEIFKQVPGTADLSTDTEDGEPEARVVINREVAIYYGITAYDINNSLKASLDGVKATTIKLSGKEVDVRIQMDQTVKESIPNMLQILIPTRMGGSVPLGQIATIEYGNSPSQIYRENQVRTLTIFSRLEGRDLRSVTNDMQKAVEEYNLPPGYSYSFGGEQQEMAEAFGGLGLALILSVLLVYMILASQFESLIHPFTIMFSVPFAFTGAFLSLFITQKALSVPAFIGMIMLAGIVVNNAIVLVDYINQLRKAGMNREEAVVDAVAVRFRPISMTTLTTVLALFPLALGLGEGAETQAPLAVVVIGGLTFSTLLTMVLIPILYTLFDDLKEKIKRVIKRKPSQNNIENVNL